MKLIINDVRQNKLSSASTVFFMAVSAMMLALTTLLFSGLFGAIDSLMDKAAAPDYMQMHAVNQAFARESSVRESETETISRFAKSRKEVVRWQICGFLNLDNSRVRLGGSSMADSTQDNGLCLQGEGFDYLLDIEGGLPEASPGEVFVPVCYRSLYHLAEGDIMEIGEERLVIAGFIRDAQMNSMMASSKRFLVHKEDYERIRDAGFENNVAAEELLIEFLLRDGADSNAFAAAYAAAGLLSDGPAITRPLIRTMNALSEGTMIFVIFLISIVTLLISMLCIRFLCLIQMEREWKEVGMLKVLGVGAAEIMRLYIAKYFFFSVLGALAGLSAAFALKEPLEKQVRELYGAAKPELPAGIWAVAAVCLAEGMILISVRQSLKRTEKISALEALFSAQEEKGGKGRYLIIGLVAFACTFLVMVPQNLYSTMSAPEFVRYMGIGEGEIRMDVGRSKEIEQVTERIAQSLLQDRKVEKFTLLVTRNYTAVLPGGERVRLAVESGDHGVFPVKYGEGKLPEGPFEIALSALNAKELGLSLGDSLLLESGGRAAEYTVCGIYSDITNGGKTAKAYGAAKDAPVIWSVLYASLNEAAGKENESVGKKEWMEGYRRMGADVTDIHNYVEDTYRQTLSRLYLASIVSALLAGAVTMVVVSLFIRLLVEEKRYGISLYKALGFTGKDMKKIYFLKGLLPAVAGCAAGIIVGNPLGEGICAAVMKSFGAEGFRFTVSWGFLFTRILTVVLAPAVLALWAGVSEIGKVEAYECCQGRAPGSNGR